MLVVPYSNKESDLVSLMSNNLLLVDSCYKRQLDLILEIKKRGQNKT